MMIDAGLIRDGADANPTAGPRVGGCERDTPADQALDECSPRPSSTASAMPDVGEAREATKVRLIQLDVLRGVAILLVLNFHYVIAPGRAGRLQSFARRIYMLGWSGVDLFFVLSGFLIGGLLFEELRRKGHLDIGRFIIRRGFKIWPSYFVYLAFLFVLLWTTGGARAAARSLMPNLLHIQNYAPGPRGHTWSLAVEEHFYLMLPFVLLALTGRQSRRLASIPALPWIAAAVFAGCLGVRLAVPSSGRPFYTEVRWTHYYPTHARIDSLFFGVFIAYFYHFRPDVMRRLTQRRALLMLAGIVLIVPLASYSLLEARWIVRVGFTMAYLGYGCILLAVISTPLGEGWLGRLLSSRPARIVAFIGVYSYPIYLWHIDAAQEPLQRLLASGSFSRVPEEARWLLIMAAYVGLATAAGVLMGKLIERPALALRDRLFPSRIDPLDASDSPPWAEPARRSVADPVCSSLAPPVRTGADDPTADVGLNRAT
jgi:peptidoglycan/LPS O-acetylase OafA/YrhL